MSMSRGHRYIISLRRAVLVSILLFTAAAQAATFTVDSTTDAVDATPGDGICADAAGHCTLRAAIQEANALAGADTITLPTGLYTLTLTTAGADPAASGDLDITGDLTINGAGATTTTIDGGGLNRVFNIAPSGTSPTVTISNLTIRNGMATSAAGGAGGAILINLGNVTLNDCILSSNKADTNGGAIINSAGTLVINRCTLSTNLANGNGGGLYNAATATLDSTTLSGNNATSQGGGLYNAATVTLTNSTLSGNNATALGGGVYNAVTSNATVLFTTLALNTAVSGGGVYNAGSVTLTSTLLNSNAGGNCRGTIGSGGTNLDSDGSCALSATGDLSNIDPLLGPLAANGGTIATQALLTGSPAIDKASNTGCPAKDQRGVSRPVDGNGDNIAVCDIGAYEATAPADLAISNHHQADCVKLHDPLIYTIGVTNNGPGNASNVTVTDTLPVGVTFVSTSPACSQNGYTLTCGLNNISAGGTATITINVTADKVAQLTNTASVQAAEVDPDTSNNSADEVTRVNCAKGCFIATAAYGSPMEAHVQSLRVFRDRYLIPNPVGNWFVGLYYQYSPPLAEVLRQHDDMRALVRLGLQPLVSFAEFANDLQPEHDQAAPGQQ
jgi:uncharacterized repeat protein (TIGR01451 family)/CSLREA domain-containing protein